MHRLEVIYYRFWNLIFIFKSPIKLKTENFQSDVQEIYKTKT